MNDDNNLVKICMPQHQSIKLNCVIQFKTLFLHFSIFFHIKLQDEHFLTKTAIKILNTRKYYKYNIIKRLQFIFKKNFFIC